MLVELLIGTEKREIEIKVVERLVNILTIICADQCLENILILGCLKAYTGLHHQHICNTYYSILPYI